MKIRYVVLGLIVLGIIVLNQVGATQMPLAQQTSLTGGTQVVTHHTLMS